MPSLTRSLTAALLLTLASATVSSAQTPGLVFRHNDAGITYEIPSQFSSKVESDLPQDPTGHEHMILALWDSPRRTGMPRMTFIYDTRVRSGDSSREAMAKAYLKNMRPGMLKWEGVKISDPRTIVPAGYEIWRMDYWHPADSGPPFNSAIVIPLPDRRILAIQLSAPTQAELDAEVDSLRTLRLDQK